MTQFSQADRVYGDGELPGDADFSAPTGKVADVSPLPAKQPGAETTTATIKESKKRRKND